MAISDEAEVASAPASVGQALRAAREAEGKSRADIAAETRVSERQLALIEEGRFGQMASRTYAVGFARAYARSVGLDEFDVAERVRRELNASDADPTHHATTFEPGDPARVPGSRTAFLAIGGAAAVIGLLLFFWRSYYLPASPLPDLTTEPTPVASPAAAPRPVASVAAPAGPVVFTATQPGVWVKFYDASGTQLMQKELAQGESYMVPPEAQGPLVWTARPDALQVTIGGKPVPPLADRQMTVKDVPVSASALLARGSLPPAVVPTAAAPAPAARMASSRPASKTPQGTATAASVAPAAPAPVPAVPAAAAPPVAAQESTVSQ